LSANFTSNSYIATFANDKFIGSLKILNYEEDETILAICYESDDLIKSCPVDKIEIFIWSREKLNSTKREEKRIELLNKMQSYCVDQEADILLSKLDEENCFFLNSTEKSLKVDDKPSLIVEVKINQEEIVAKLNESIKIDINEKKNETLSQFDSLFSINESAINRPAAMLLEKNVVHIIPIKSNDSVFNLSLSTDDSILSSINITNVTSLDLPISLEMNLNESLSKYQNSSSQILKEREFFNTTELINEQSDINYNDLNSSNNTIELFIEVNKTKTELLKSDDADQSLSTEATESNNRKGSSEINTTIKIEARRISDLFETFLKPNDSADGEATNTMVTTIETIKSNISKENRFMPHEFDFSGDGELTFTTNYVKQSTTNTNDSEVVNFEVNFKKTTIMITEPLLSQFDQTNLTVETTTESTTLQEYALVVNRTQDSILSNNSTESIANQTSVGRIIQTQLELDESVRAIGNSALETSSNKNNEVDTYIYEVANATIKISNETSIGEELKIKEPLVQTHENETRNQTQRNVEDEQIINKSETPQTTLSLSPSYTAITTTKITTVTSGQILSSIEMNLETSSGTNNKTDILTNSTELPKNLDKGKHEEIDQIKDLKSNSSKEDANVYLINSTSTSTKINLDEIFQTKSIQKDESDADEDEADENETDKENEDETEPNNNQTSIKKIVETKLLNKLFINGSNTNNSFESQEKNNFNSTNETTFMIKNENSTSQSINSIDENLLLRKLNSFINDSGVDDSLNMTKINEKTATSESVLAKATLNQELSSKESQEQSNEINENKLKAMTTILATKVDFFDKENNLTNDELNEEKQAAISKTEKNTNKSEILELEIENETSTEANEMLNEEETKSDNLTSEIEKEESYLNETLTTAANEKTKNVTDVENLNTNQSKQSENGELDEEKEKIVEQENEQDLKTSTPNENISQEAEVETTTITTTSVSTTTIITTPATTTTPYPCQEISCQVLTCSFGRRKDENQCDTCDCMTNPNGTNECAQPYCHPCFYGAFTDENGCESCACKPRPKPKSVYECPKLDCVSCNYGSIKDEYGCETCICIRPNSLERSYSCPPDPTCPYGSCKYGSVLNDYGCATCDCLKSTEPDRDECVKQRCPPCPHGHFTDSNGCEACLCKPDWMAPCGLVHLSCDASKCEHGTYLDRNGCPSCECLPDPNLR
jgi:hypothetical protein